MGYMDSLAHYYDLSTPVALPDLGIPGGNPGTGANIASNPVGIHGNSRCASMNGTNSAYNLGSIAELSEVSAFTIAFWMRQDVLDVTDSMFYYAADGTHEIRIYTLVGGDMYWENNNGAAQFVRFDYSTVIGAGQWHHLACTFDGSLADAVKHSIYVDGFPVALALGGTQPTVTADLSGANALIGHASTSFDGLLDAFAIFTRPLTQLQVADFKLATAQGRI